MIRSITDFIKTVRTDSSSWNPKEPIWFRGEPDSRTPLLPTLYRENLAAYENPLLQMFRQRASGYHDVVPDVERTDQWLFLAQHAGVPTRLLDWTEGALLGLHFALKHEKPVVWMLNPLDLNDIAASGKISPPGHPMREFPLTWVDNNSAFDNISGAWLKDRRGVQLPVAVHPTYVHRRLPAQRSCFTVHGKQKQGLATLVPSTSLKRYAFHRASRQSMIKELRTLGVTDSVAFPDLDGLAKELKTQFLLKSRLSLRPSTRAGSADPAARSLATKSRSTWTKLDNCASSRRVSLISLSKSSRMAAQFVGDHFLNRFGDDVVEILVMLLEPRGEPNFPTAPIRLGARVELTLAALDELGLATLERIAIVASDRLVRRIVDALEHCASFFDGAPSARGFVGLGFKIVDHLPSPGL